MDAEINNVICMELYSGAKMVDDKYLKTNNMRSMDRDFTVLHEGSAHNVKFLSHFV
jgi:hypothetical protein